jgi:plasmid stabilization system protein ParE
MDTQHSLTFSPVFKYTLKRLDSFLTRKYSSGLAKKVRQEIRCEISTALPSNPYIGPVCERLIDLGVAGYHQLLVGSHNTVIYSVDENAKTIIVLLVFDNRQSIQKLLSEISLVL